MPIFRLISLVFLMVFLLVPLKGIGQSFPFRTAIIEMKVIEEEADRRTESVSKLWIDYEGQRYCSETEMITPGGKGVKYVTIQSDGKVYMLNVEQKTAQEIPSSEEGKILFDLNKTPDYKRFRATKVGTDTIAGWETDVFEYITFEDRPQYTLGQEKADSLVKGGEELKDLMSKSAVQSKVRQWIWKKTDFPLKTIVDNGPRRTITETVHIAVDVPLPERVFKVPKEYTIKKMQN